MSREGDIRSRNQAMATFMKERGVTRTTTQCPNGHHRIGLDNLVNHLRSCTVGLARKSNNRKSDTKTVATCYHPEPAGVVARALFRNKMFKTHHLIKCSKCKEYRVWELGPDMSAETYEQMFTRDYV